MSESTTASVAPARRFPKLNFPPELTRIKVPRPVRWILGILLALVAAVLIFLAFADWNMLRGPIGRFASARLERTVELRGDLKVHPFRWTPRAEINDLYIADADWSGGEHLVRIPRIEVSVELLPLFKGEVILPRLALVRPDIRLKRLEDGRSNWKFGGDNKDKEPAKFPAIRHLILDEGRLAYDSAGDKPIALRATLTTSEKTEGGGAFRLDGDGSINRESFKLKVTGGPLINIDPDKPYPFDVDIRAGATRLVARGDVTEPFDLGRFSSAFDLSGPDLNRVYGLTGLALPNTPPYRLRGRLTRAATLYTVSGLNGSVGDSDLGGTFSVETKGERPLLKGDLVSRRLDFDDLATIFGGPPSTARGENATPEQRAAAARLNSEGRLMPDATLNAKQIRAMDAEVRYRATSVLASNLPLRDVAVAVDLKAGLMKLSDIRFGFPRGQITGTAQLDARQATPLVDIDLRATGLALQQFVTLSGGTPVTGTLVGRAKLSGAGNSVRRAAASADGTVTIVVPRGEIREAFAELAGVNVIKGLGLLFQKDQGKVDLSCAVFDFRAKDGILSANRLLIDTEPVLITGGGTVSLRDETLDLEFKGNPKKFRLISLNVPVTLTGTLSKPDPGARPGGAIAQGGIAAALAAVVNPLAAVLPFVDLGLADDADCSALLSGARSKGAPVTRGQTAAR